MEYTKGERKVVFNPAKNKFEVRVFKGASVLGTLASFVREPDAHLDAAAPALYEAGIEVRDNAVLQEQENGYYLLRLSYASWRNMCQALAEAEEKLTK